MTVRVNKSAFNIREKLSELERPIGVKGNELMRAETAQDARDFVSAGRKNLVINGDMKIDQRGGTHTTKSGYCLDRWKFLTDLLDEYAHEVTKSSDSPDGFNNSLRLEVTTSESAIDTLEDLALTHIIEAQDCQALQAGTSSAKPFTLSFWVKCTKTGTFSVSAAIPNGNKIFTTTYTVNSSSTWEHKIIRIPPCTITTIPNTNASGLILRWIINAGSAYTTASGGNMNEWDDYASSLFAGGHVTQIATDGDIWQITGVQLEVGKNATEFEHRSYGEELALCQRYFLNPLQNAPGSRSTYPITYVFAGATNGWTVFQVPFPVPMRVPPTLSHNISDSNRVSGSPSSTQWSFYRQNQAYPGKQGGQDMSVLNASSNTTQANVGAYYASPSSESSAILFGSDLTFHFNAEL